MPRPERALDPAAGPVEAFAQRLRTLRQQAGNPGYRILAARAGLSISTLADAAGGRRLPSLAVTLAFVRACDGDPAGWADDWRTAAAQIAAQAPTRTDEPAPYQGLTSYDTGDAALFFGRRRAVAALVDLLDRHRLVAVFGASGSGKSSLLRAGLIPAVATRQPVVLTPGGRPVETLRAVLDPVPADRDVLLVIDQFEEVFTLCREPEARVALITELAELIHHPAGRHRVVLGIRADFLARCAELPGLAELLAGACLPVPPLTGDELHEVVTRPAVAAGLTVERALTATILADAARQPGALPLVSHALLETWQQRRSQALTVAGYHAAGGVAGAVGKTAETVYAGFDGPRVDTARAVLVRLVTLGDGVEDTRRRVTRAELDFPEVDAVLESLAAARLVVLGADTVEIAHEALIAAWPRLRGWLEADRETLRRHRQLTEAAQVWQALERDPGALYRGARLAAWRDQPMDQLTTAERGFLAASRQARDGELAARRWRRRLTTTSLTVAIVVLSILTTVALVQADRAARERDLARAGRLAADARTQLALDPELALLLARQAERVSSTGQTQAVLRQATEDSRVRATLAAHQGPVTDVSFSPDGRWAAASGADGTIRVWPVAEGLPRGEPVVLRGHAGEVSAVVFHPGGSRLASVGVDGTLRLWDMTAAGRALVVLPGHQLAVAFSRDGRWLAAPGRDGVVQVWESGGHGSPVVLRTGGNPRSVAFSPDGSRLAVGTGNGTTSVWDLAARAEVLRRRSHQGWVNSLAFSPDGRFLASSSTDGTAQIHRGDGTGDPAILRGHDGAVAGVGYSMDGRRLVTAGQDGTVRIWSAGSTLYPMVLRGHDGMVSAASFSPDGRRVASASDDGTVRFWDATTVGDPVVLRGHQGAAWQPALSQDGRLLASAGEDGTVRIHDPTGTRESTVLRGHTGEATSVGFRPDGGQAVSTGTDGTVRVWHTTGVANPTVLTGHTDLAWSAAFSPDGQRIVSASRDGTVRVWDPTGRTPALVLRGHQGNVRQATFSADGRQVVSAGVDGTVRRWPLTGGEPTVLRGHYGPVRTVAASPDGRFVASGGNDGTVRLWPRDPSGPVTILRGHQGVVWAVAFSPDGNWIAASGNDGTLRIWPTSGGEPVVYRGFGATVEGIAVGTGGTLVTAHGDGTVRVWRCTVCGPIAQVRTLADSRLVRGLTAEEARTFLTLGGVRQPIAGPG